MPSNITEELLIVSLTPQNLERGALWFSENLAQIKKARTTNLWWQNNSFFIEQDLIIKPGEFIRRLIDLGYERTAGAVVGKGLFSVRGGLVELWPINTKNPYLVEFHGNRIEVVQERPETEEKIKLRAPAKSIDALPAGNYVVHIDHGIGIFQGIAAENEFQNPNFKFYKIEYAPARSGGKPDTLYVPTDQKNRLSPYIGFETPRIHRLGGTLWENTKRKVREDAEKLAKELLELYSRRHLTEREPYEGDKTLESELRHSFEYEETADQLRSEKEILQDLEKRPPLDRILCGDVGFGKTEIALRIALRIIASGKQVAVLTPTTVLAAQHEKTFADRLRNLGVRVQMLSRLNAPKVEKQTLQEITEGKIDCLIGTHRLLSRDVKFKNLGLLIIDEEQRFGVKQKEYFKKLRAGIDVLSLSATPIPRTLSLALTKIRDLSLIETPPPERKPIETFVLPYSKKIILRAIDFEFKRHGQVYFLHNRIETLSSLKEKITKEAKNYINKTLNVGIIHGRMKEKEIINVMEQFRNKKIDVLFATTIIENGLDVSSANTLVVDDATLLGLAEAHQLRGRIGRGAEKAYAYFFYRPRHLTEKSLERLQALKEYSELGAGYQIALRDLEIRGAGNVLGREQSGAVNKVGLNLYCQILSEAVETIEKKIPHENDRVVTR